MIPHSISLYSEATDDPPWSRHVLHVLFNTGRVLNRRHGPHGGTDGLNTTNEQKNKNAVVIFVPVHDALSALGSLCRWLGHKAAAPFPP